MSPSDTTDFKNATKCYVCNAEFTSENCKVRDHCHYNGVYRGASHSRCNLRQKQPRFIPMLFHKLEGYDSHLFVRNLGVSEGNIKYISKTEEKYISFSKELVVEEYTDENGNLKSVKRELRFIDSLKFTLSSLDKLIKNLGEDDFKNLSTMTKKYTSEQKQLLRQKGVFPYEYMDFFKR